MMQKRMVSLALALIALFSVLGSAFAESKETVHDKDIEAVLLGTMWVPCNSNEKELDILQWAAYFALDCYGKANKEEQPALKKLRDYGIPNVPKKVADFHYEGGKFGNQHHERPTHMGWNDEQFSKDIAGGKTTRKKLLINTFERVFIRSEKKWWDPADLMRLFQPTADETVKKQCESLAALVYYTHILGDHCYNSRTTLLDRIPLVRKTPGESNPDLLFELKKHLGVLFRSQKRKAKYLKLTRGIDAIRAEWPETVGVYDFDIKTDEQYKAYQQEAEKLMELLKDNVHPLLKNEEFFAKVFYPAENEQKKAA